MISTVDTDKFIISRKRKKYRFAKFLNASNCFEADEWEKRSVDVLEIGAGTGLFSLALAEKYPDKTFAALDVKADRLQKGAYEALERGVKNIYFVRGRADQITELFPDHSIAEIWVTFPDPFPKKRSAGRRLMHPSFLQKYATLLVQHGALNLKHDNPDFFAWSLEQLVADRWHIDELSFDLHDTPDDTFSDAKILTTYEKRWLADGRRTNFVSALAVDT
jgi:tRNA (guanine-N7-)-methyltransferase